MGRPAASCWGTLRMTRQELPNGRSWYGFHYVSLLFVSYCFMCYLNLDGNSKTLNHDLKCQSRFTNPTFGFGLTPTASTLASWPISQINVEKDPERRNVWEGYLTQSSKDACWKRHLSQICPCESMLVISKKLGCLSRKMFCHKIIINNHQHLWSPTNALNIRNSLKKGLTPLSIWLKLTAKCCCWFTYTLTCWYLQGGTPS